MSPSASSARRSGSRACPKSLRGERFETELGTAARPEILGASMVSGQGGSPRSLSDPGGRWQDAVRAPVPSAPAHEADLYMSVPWSIARDPCAAARRGWRPWRRSLTSASAPCSSSRQARQTAGGMCAPHPAPLGSSGASRSSGISRFLH